MLPRISNFFRNSVRLTVTLASVGALAITALVAQQLHEQSKSLNPLVGTWTISVQPLHCKVAAYCNAFTQMETYSSDGTVVAFDSATPPSGETITLGPWKEISAGRYLESTYQFVLDDNGNPGTLTVLAESDLNPAGDGFNGPYTYKWVDQDGNVIDEGDGIAEGSKLTLDDPAKVEMQRLNVHFRYRSSARR